MTFKEGNDGVIAELRQIADKARNASATFKPHEESIKKPYEAAMEIGNGPKDGLAIILGFTRRVSSRFAQANTGIQCGKNFKFHRIPHAESGLSTHTKPW
jgi:hypothetical protein